MKAAAYARYSTDLQTENSIAYQLESINKYCRENNIDICSIYKDEAQSGTNTDRKGFKQLVKGAEKGEFEAVVIYDISRGSRDVGDWFSFRKAMMLHNIKVISTTQNLGDMTNPNDFIIELITVGMGQHDVLSSRQKSIDGVAVKAKQGIFLGGYPPLGYDILSGQYIINEAEAKTVRKIFNMYAAGDSYNKIIDTLGGICGKRGRPIGKNSLISILKNERYIGVYTWNKKKMKVMRKWAGGRLNPDCVRIEDAIPPIIDMDTWERVRNRMKNTQNRAANKAKRTYLLSGLIVCAECGAAYVGHTSTNKKGYETGYYICGNKYRTKECHAKNINANEIETFVVQHLKNYLLNTNFEETANTIANQINNAGPTLLREKAELAEVTKKINNGVKAILSGAEFPELEEEIHRLRTRKSELEDIISVNTSDRPQVDPAAIVKLFQDSIASWNEENIPNIIKYHITKIYAHSDGSYEVEIGVHTDYCGGRI